jgi:hypothetical protein
MAEVGGAQHDLKRGFRLDPLLFEHQKFLPKGVEGRPSTLAFFHHSIVLQATDSK